MNDKDKKVVNTEEQNRAVNPGSSEDQESAPHEEPITNNKTNSQGEIEKPEKGSEVERPHPIEGDDADSIERKIPDL
jgi:hypothetical protein